MEAGLTDFSSSAAEQGTAEHALAEWKPRHILYDDPIVKPVSDWIDTEMDALTDDYVAFVLERLSDVRQNCTELPVLIEQQLDFPASYLAFPHRQCLDDHRVLVVNR